LLVVLRVSIVLGLLGLAARPESAIRQLAGSYLVAMWKTVGDSIVGHEIASLSRQLEEERGLLNRMRLRRDALAKRLEDRKLRSLQYQLTGLEETRRESSEFITASAWDEGDHDDKSDCYLQARLERNQSAAWTDDAFASITIEISRIDHQLETAQRALRVKEHELFVLDAEIEARQIRHELSGTGAPFSWNARVSHMSETLQPTGIRPSSN
jgi:hypothetical protein